MSLEDKDELIRCIWLHFVLFHPHAELEQLRKGLYQTLQFELLVCTHPNVVWGVLAASTVFNVTPEYLCSVFEVEYYEKGSNNRPKEEAVIFFWFEYITESADRKDVTVEEILKFVSGWQRFLQRGSTQHQESTSLMLIAFLQYPPAICPSPFLEEWDAPNMKTSGEKWTFASLGHMGLELYKDCHNVLR